MKALYAAVKPDLHSPSSMLPYSLVEDAPSLRVRLWDYQRRATSWMVSRERNANISAAAGHGAGITSNQEEIKSSTNSQFLSMHPLWHRFAVYSTTAQESTHAYVNLFT